MSKLRWTWRLMDGAGEVADMPDGTEAVMRRVGNSIIGTAGGVEVSITLTDAPPVQLVQIVRDALDAALEIDKSVGREADFLFPSHPRGEEYDF